MASKALPCPTLLRQLLRYEPDTGRLFWKKRPVWMFSDGHRDAAGNCNNWNARYSEKPAFTAKMKNGYRIGAVGDRSLLAHRVIWAIVNGEWPEDQVDHINGDRQDNRLKNLRSVCRAENNKNSKRPCTNTSGVVGVGWRPRQNKWLAQIKTGGKAHYLGCFDDKQDAIRARKDAERKYGFHKNHGR